MTTYIFTIYNPVTGQYNFYEEFLGYYCSEKVLNNLLRNYCMEELIENVKTYDIKTYEESLSKSFWEMKGDMV